MFWRLRDSVPSYTAIGFALVALVAVDSTVAGSRTDGSSASAAPAIVQVAQGQSSHGLLPGVRTLGVASGHGEIWALVVQGSSYAVEEINPTTQRAGASYRMTSPASHIFYGAGRVWLTGANRVSALNPASGHFLTHRLGNGAKVSAMVFHGTTAYAALGGHDELLTLRPGRTFRAKLIAERGGPAAVVALSGAIQPTNRMKNLIPIIFRDANTSFLAEISRLRPVIASAGKRAVWVHSGKGLIRITVPSGGTIRRGNDIASRQHFATDIRVRQIMMTPGGDSYVSAQNRGGRSHRNLLYFSRAALRAKKPVPTATHRGLAALGLALDPAGGVVYADRTGKLRRWVPRTK
jgi:hypothetical protein